MTARPEQASIAVENWNHFCWFSLGNLCCHLYLLGIFVVHSTQWKMKKNNGKRTYTAQMGVNESEWDTSTPVKIFRNAFYNFRRFRTIDSWQTVYCVYLRGTNWQNEVDKMKHFSSLKFYTSKFRCAHIPSPSIFKDIAKKWA